MRLAGASSIGLNAFIRDVYLHASFALAAAEPGLASPPFPASISTRSLRKSGRSARTIARPTGRR